MCREHLHTPHHPRANTPDIGRARERQSAERGGEATTADFTVHRPHHLPVTTTPLTLTPPTLTAAVKINKTRNKLRIDFVFVFSISIFCILRLRTPCLYDTLLNACQIILYSRFLPHSIFYRGRCWRERINVIITVFYEKVIKFR